MSASYHLTLYYQRIDTRNSISERNHIRFECAQKDKALHTKDALPRRARWSREVDRRGLLVVALGFQVEVEVDRVEVEDRVIQAHRVCLSKMFLNQTTPSTLYRNNDFNANG